ncbi:MAG TPA: D-glycerate dehydrogenase [Gemmatimonadaceae bacterium]
MTKVFISRRIPAAGLEILERAGVELRIGQEREDAGVDPAVMLDGIKWCDVLLSLLTEPIGRALLEANKNLRGVANYAVGFNNIDVAAATELGLPVSNTPDVLTDTSADLTWALLLAAARRIPEAHEYMKAGRYKLWGPNLLLGADVSPGGNGVRKVLGIVGFGRIGAAVAKRAAGFDMDVIAYDPHARAQVEASGIARWADFDELLTRSDFVSLHPLLTDETRHLIDKRALRRMKPSAILVNVSRGPVVDEAALVRALRERWIAGAALDVFENEPAMAPGLAECETAVIVPHIASASIGTRDRMATMAAENALAHLRGERAPNVVNAGVYSGDAYRARIARPLRA